MVRFITVQFDYGENKNYDLLLRVLEVSVAKNMPNNAILDMIIAPPPPYVDKTLPISQTVNTKKLEYWCKIMDEAKDGERLIFIDCDMIVTGNMEEAFGRSSFDIGYTIRTLNIGYPLNGGVVFVNVNDLSREFMRQWKVVNDRMYNDPSFLGPWRRKYAGMNQASFGYMLENVTYTAKIQAFDCMEFNLVDDGWRSPLENVKAIHIKGMLRKACLDFALTGTIQPFKHSKVDGPLREWIKYYKSSKYCCHPKPKHINFVITHFDYESDGIFNTLADVLQYSIGKNVPGSRVIREILQAPEDPGISRAFVSNSIKLDSWMDVLWGLEEESKVVFIDADTIVTGDLSEVFDKKFDIAYTCRTKSQFPINGGVIFIKRNERAIVFLQKFKAINNEMLHDRVFHKKWQAKYAGINQAAFGWMLENYRKPVTLLPLPCSIYNACNEDWAHLDGRQKVIHIKGNLRSYLFPKISKEMPVNEKEFGLALHIWRQYHDEYVKSCKC